MRAEVGTQAEAGLTHMSQGQLVWNDLDQLQELCSVWPPISLQASQLLFTETQQADTAQGPHLAWLVPKARGAEAWFPGGGIPESRSPVGEDCFPGGSAPGWLHPFPACCDVTGWRLFRQVSVRCDLPASTLMSQDTPLCFVCHPGTLSSLQQKSTLDTGPVGESGHCHFCPLAFFQPKHNTDPRVGTWAHFFLELCQGLKPRVSVWRLEAHGQVLAGLAAAPASLPGSATVVFSLRLCVAFLVRVSTSVSMSQQDSFLTTSSHSSTCWGTEAEARNDGEGGKVLQHQSSWEPHLTQGQRSEYGLSCLLSPCTLFCYVLHG